ncbi:hypothetical protein BSKO_02479 [Bryopsis sp. KO-2023]|nr:hypothetical protein BSKO_02479 [Bryopsis sp. KO-2023]
MRRNKHSVEGNLIVRPGWVIQFVESLDDKKRKEVSEAHEEADMKTSCDITKTDIPTLDFLIDAGAFDESGHTAVEALLGDLAVDVGDPLHPAQGSGISSHASGDGHETAVCSLRTKGILKV